MWNFIKLCNYRYSRAPKTVPVQNIDTVHLQIFQNTEHCSSAKHWYFRTLTTAPVQNIATVQFWIFQNTDNCWLWVFQKTVQNIDELCTYRYSGTLNTVPVCSIDIHKHWWLMSFWDTYKLCSYRHVYKHTAVLWSWILIPARLPEYPCSLDMLMGIMHTSIPEHSYQWMTFTLN